MSCFFLTHIIYIWTSFTFCITLLYTIINIYVQLKEKKMLMQVIKECSFNSVKMYVAQSKKKSKSNKNGNVLTALGECLINARKSKKLKTCVICGKEDKKGKKKKNKKNENKSFDSVAFLWKTVI